MVEPLFDPEKCDIGFVPKVTFDFLPNCRVAAAPPPIHDCPEIEIPLDPPTPGQICIDLGVSSQLTTHVGDPSLTITATRIVNNPGVECAFMLDIDLTLPPVPTFDDVCPTVSVASTTTVGTGPPNADVVMTRITDEGACSLKFDFHFDFPEFVCPTFNASATTTVQSGPPNVDVVIEQNGGPSDCEVDLLFGFTLPNPACPAITATATTVVTESPTPSVDIVLTKIDRYRTYFSEEMFYDEETSSSSVILVEYEALDPTQCSTVWDFGFSLPGCASIDAAGTLTVLPGVEPSLDVVATKKEEGCGTDLDFAFTLPCPEVSATSTVSIARGQPAAHLDVIRPVPDQCGLEVQLSLTFPPTIDCPTFAVSTHMVPVVGLLSSLDAVITKRNEPPIDGVSQCAFDFDLYLFSPPVGLWPATLTTNVVGGQATVQLPDFSFRLAYDNGQFGCAKAGANAIVAIDPSTGLTRIVNSESRAGDILVELTEPMEDQVTNNATVLHYWGSKGDIQFDTGSEPSVTVHDPADVAKGAKPEEKLIARWDCPEQAYIAVSRGGEQRALLIQGILNEAVVGTEDEVEVGGPTPLTPPPYTAIPEMTEEGMLMVKNPRKHMGQQDDNIVANWNDTQSQWELLDVEKHWLRVSTGWTIGEEDKIIQKFRIIAAETWEEEDTSDTMDTESCQDNDS